MRRFLALLAASTLLAAGCGDDGDAKAGGSSKADFTKQVEAICKERQEAVAGASEGRIQGEREMFQDELDAYAGVSPPAELEQPWQRYVGLMTKAQQDFEAWTKAASSEDPDVRSGQEFHLPYTRWQRNGAQARRIAKEIGLPTCGEHVY